MSDAWNLHLDDGVLTVELTAGIESAEFERLYDGLVREISAVEAVLIDVGGIQMTNTGSQLPIEFAEYLAVLEESIDSLRANMRAASDETAMMEQTEPVLVVTSAVSQAAEHVERARDALRALSAMVSYKD